MCFSIPAKVLRIEKNKAIIEGNRVIAFDNHLKVYKGDYLQIAGNVAVGKLSNKEGLKIRQLIKRLN